ncbi:MAG: AAA family ATPase [Synergistaceae bacterium]|nr:AAA family ATPase [Synergistaceae bacterium]
MDISGKGFTELICGRDFSDSDKQALIEKIENSAWASFMRSDAPLLMMPDDFTKVLDIQRDYGVDVKVCPMAVSYIKSSVPHIMEIIGEKANELKLKLVAARIADFAKHGDVTHIKKLYVASDWSGLARCLGALNPEVGFAELLDRLLPKANAEAENKPLSPSDIFGSDPFGWEIFAGAQNKEKAEQSALPEAILSAVKNSSAIEKEKAFISGIDKNVFFSYRVDAPDKMLNGAIITALSDALRASGRAISESVTYKAIPDFKPIVTRYSDTEFNYSSLPNSSVTRVLCVEDFDLLPMLSPKEFKEFLSYFRSSDKSTHFFFGDFSSVVAALPGLMRDFELALNIRDFDAREIKIDETGIIASAFEERGISFAEGARAAMDAAWAKFRNAKLGESLQTAIEHFITKSEFSSYVENGAKILSAGSFAWTGSNDQISLSATGGAPASLNELDGLVGMESVKANVKSFATHAVVLKAKTAAGMSADIMNLSFLFLGNPGTGKTTVARVLARVLRELGLLKQGQLVTASRNTLIAEYIGQTAPKVTEVFMSALGGVLFVDEAYSLHDSNRMMDSYGREAVNTLTLLMSEFAGRIAVIFAGYEEEMDNMFSEVNPGLRDRFAYRFIFDDYGEYDLWRIFRNNVSTAGLALEEGADAIIKAEIARQSMNRDRHFGNARTMGNLFQALVNIQEDRLAPRIYAGEKIPETELAALTVGDCKKLAESNVSRYPVLAGRAIGFGV